jgi:dipeptidyl aminopeptidase/acylaminoacyl peptidase
MKRERFKISSKGKTIRGILDIPEVPYPMPGMILCHGTTNDKYTCPLIEYASKFFVARGTAVVRFDFFGSGESDGIFRDKTISDMIQNLNDIIDYSQSRSEIDRHKIGLWGRSVGGTVVAACSNPDEIETNILISPPVLLCKTFLPLFERFGKREITPIGLSSQAQDAATGKVKGELELSKRFFGELECLDKQIEKNLARMKSVLIVQGDNDKKVSVENARYAYNLVQEPKRLVILRGADHAYSGKENEVMKLIDEWIGNLANT